jgi:hypothetical protein
VRLKLENLLQLGIILQIISTQGILTFIFFNIFGQWEIKKLIHPISLILIFVYFFLKALKKIKISAPEILLLGYLFISFIVLIFNSNSILSIYLSFRETILLFILIYIYSQTVISNKKWEVILRVLYYLVLANLSFVALTYYLGPEDYMKLLTGRYYWGHDLEYKFKISNFFSFWRTPGLIGSPGNLGYFGLIVYILFDGHKKYVKKKYFALMLVSLCFIRSVYLALIIYILLKFFVKKKNLKRLILFLKFSAPVFFITGGILYQHNVLSLESFFMRLNNWTDNVNVNYNPFFGGALGKLGAAVRGQGFEATIDGYWIYLFLSIGLVGIILIVLFFYEKTFKSNKLIIACISFLFAGFFITITQSIPFLVLFPLLFIKVEKLNRIEIEESYE